jgi:diguanylate cyclase (GGDEF)-like protein
VASALSEAVRASDRCFRWGGDEFVVLLPDTPLLDATMAADRICEAINRRCSLSDGTPVTASCAAAELGDGDHRDLLHRADAALRTRKADRPASQRVSARGHAAPLAE